MFVNGPGDHGSTSGRVIPKTQKRLLDSSLLNTQHHKVCIKEKIVCSTRINECIFFAHKIFSHPIGFMILWSHDLKNDSDTKRISLIITCFIFYLNMLLPCKSHSHVIWSNLNVRICKENIDLSPILGPQIPKPISQCYTIPHCFNPHGDMMCFILVSIPKLSWAEIRIEAKLFNKACY